MNVDYKLGVVTMLLGSIVYYLTAHYLGVTIDNLKNANKELEDEIQRRKNTEIELNEKLTLIQSLIDTIPSPIFLKDIDCRYIKCNRTYESSIGIRENDLIKKNVYDIFAKELADTYRKIEDELLDNKVTQVYETVMSFADGSLRNVILSEALFNDTTGNPIGIVGVITDISDKKESELLRQSLDEKKQFIDEIVEYDKMKTEFFANISHELRTPLNVILGSVQLIEMYAGSNTYSNSEAKVVRNIAIMRQNCYRLLRLVNNLIDITKIDACAFEIHLKNCNIVSIVEEITLSVSEYVENKGISLVFDTDIEEKIIACDDEKIERIILNLLSNAVKFTPEGGSIYVNVYDRGNNLCIKVSDNGIGIPEDKQREIFQRFCQISNILSRQHEGSGIGLNLVKSLVEMHGGTISVESEFGKGTVFTMNLPIRAISEEESGSKPLAKQDYVEKIHIEFSDVYSVC
jgi:PAS domain S-box-containing protein